MFWSNWKQRRKQAISEQIELERKEHQSELEKRTQSY